MLRKLQLTLSYIDLPASVRFLSNYTNISRNMTAIEVVDYLMISYIEAPVKEWGTILQEADFPTLARCMSGTFSIIFTFLLPEETVNILVPILIDFFSFM